ncbi:MAG: hypothetical protein R2828_02295 [Saprospiraceae bacterium]
MSKKEITIFLIANDGTLQDRLLSETKGRYQLKRTAELDKGLAIAYSSVPDIIIIQSDLPRDHSLTICKSLKDNQLTSHIPIILILKELPSPEAVVFYHADAVLAFSFTTKELIMAMRKVISLKIQLMKRYPIFYNSDNAFTREQAYLSHFIEQLPEK